ncbi:cuticle protein 7-like isoform X4 [Schistocerca serialis cubense]|uniref:cuticle protein 7-like isoform X4 n=1 Tax=Schistocerca serialis cubense TaxID=2023355 RepID=UPI00214F334D|nr:cuticle protein 7-like isoform X4 [Schistocerca serialis cubense]
MASQAALLCVCAVVGVASAGFLGSPAVSYSAAPAVHAAPALPGALAAARADADYDPNPQYSFSYSVSDALTGDAKQQQESRSGDAVQGSYSVVEPDGAVRTVQYSAAPGAGFNAVVSRSGGAPPPPAPARVAVPAPLPGRLVPLPAALPRLAPLPPRAAPAVVFAKAPVVFAAPAVVAAPAKAAPPPPAALYGAPLKSSHTAVTTSHASYQY